jgi:hypothetical protein
MMAPAQLLVSKFHCFLHPRTQLQALKAGAQPISTELAGIVFEDGDDDATTLQKAAAVDYATLGGQHASGFTNSTLQTHHSAGGKRCGPLVYSSVRW